MRINTKDLSDVALDWAVSQCEGEVVRIYPHDSGAELFDLSSDPYSPTSYWSQGGPIIEREGIAVRKHKGSGLWFAMGLDDLGDTERPEWCEFTSNGGERYGKMSYQVPLRRQRFEGDTPLVAALRCHVAAKLGAEIEVPESLLNGD